MNRKLAVAIVWFYQWIIICFSLAIFISIGVKYGAVLNTAIIFLWLNVMVLHYETLKQKFLLDTVDRKLCGGIQLLSEAIQLQSRSVKTIFNFLKIPVNKNTDSTTTLH